MDQCKQCSEYREEIERLREDVRIWRTRNDCGDIAMRALTADVDCRIAEAVAAEREECARLLESVVPTNAPWLDRTQVVQMIRARSGAAPRVESDEEIVERAFARSAPTVTSRRPLSAKHPAPPAEERCAVMTPDGPYIMARSALASNVLCTACGKTGGHYCSANYNTWTEHEGKEVAQDLTAALAPILAAERARGRVDALRVLEEMAAERDWRGGISSVTLAEALKRCRDALAEHGGTEGE